MLKRLAHCWHPRDEVLSYSLSGYQTAPPCSDTEIEPKSSGYQTAEVLINKIAKISVGEFFVLYKWHGTFLVQVYRHVGEFLSKMDTKEELEFQELVHLANQGEKLLRSCCRHKEPLQSLETVEIACLGMDILKNALDLILSLTALFNISLQGSTWERLWTAAWQFLQEECGNCPSATKMDQEPLERCLEDYLDSDKHLTATEKQRAQLLRDMLKFFLVRVDKPRNDLSAYWPKVSCDDIKCSRILGKSSFGTVLEVELYGEKFACKKSDIYQMLRDEASVHFMLKHPNIVHAVCYTEFPDGKFGLLMELMNEFNLSSYLEVHNPIVDLARVKLAVDIICQIADAMFYLHSKNIIHRDIKARNILVERTPDLNACRLHVKLGDLDTARFLLAESTMLTYKRGTLFYMAPEVRGEEILENDMWKYGFKADVYSFGVTCYEILTGNLPRPPTGHFDAQKWRPELPDITPYKLQKLITQCWDQIPEKRPSFSEIVWRARDIKFGLSKLIRVQ